MKIHGARPARDGNSSQDGQARYFSDRVLLLDHMVGQRLAGRADEGGKADFVRSEAALAELEERSG